MDGWSRHALDRMWQRYPYVLESEYEKVIPAIETMFRKEFCRLDKTDSRVFISYRMMQKDGHKIKVKFIYEQTTKTIITALPFIGMYDKQFPIRYSHSVENYELYRFFWGS